MINFIGDKLTWLNLIYVLISIPLDIVYLLIFVVGITIGVPLFIIGVGIPFFMLSLFSSWHFGIVNWHLGRTLLGIQKDKIYKTHLSVPKKWDKMTRYMFSSHAIWLSGGYLLLKTLFTLTTAILVLILITVSCQLVIAPYWYNAPSFYLQPLAKFLAIDSIWRSLIISTTGLFLLALALRITRFLAKLYKNLILLFLCRIK